MKYNFSVIYTEELIKTRLSLSKRILQSVQIFWSWNELFEFAVLDCCQVFTRTLFIYIITKIT